MCECRYDFSVADWLLCVFASPKERNASFVLSQVRVSLDSDQCLWGVWNVSSAMEGGLLYFEVFAGSF